MESNEPRHDGSELGSAAVKQGQRYGVAIKPGTDRPLNKIVSKGQINATEHSATLDESTSVPYVQPHRTHGVLKTESSAEKEKLQRSPDEMKPRETEHDGQPSPRYHPPGEDARKEKIHEHIVRTKEVVGHYKDIVKSGVSTVADKVGAVTTKLKSALPGQRMPHQFDDKGDGEVRPAVPSDEPPIKTREAYKSAWEDANA